MNVVLTKLPLYLLLALVGWSAIPLAVSLLLAELLYQVALDPGLNENMSVACL